MPLDKDNAGHRDFSDRLDAKFTGNSFYDKTARPIIHGAYHAGRYVRSSNPEEMARAKDQFSKFGTGQSQTEYLAVYREQQKQQEQSFPKSIQEQLTPQSFQEQLTPKSWNEKLFPDLMQQQQQQQQQQQHSQSQCLTYCAKINERFYEKIINAAVVYCPDHD